VSPAVENSRHLEVEVKLPADDLESLRGTLRMAGAKSRSSLHFESNDIYDRGDGELARAGCTLRLRRTDGGSTLTFKGPARFEAGTKSREEQETSVSDPDAVERILTALGLERRFRYEKRREEWDLEGCVIALDETPIGTFVEIEGDPSAIRRVLQRLGLDFSKAIPYTYAELYRRRRRDDSSLPNDMIFQDR
jgi:adenylate cyclase class 2